MAVSEDLKAWFADLAEGQKGIATHASRHQGGMLVVSDQHQFQEWSTGAQAAIVSAFGPNSVHAINFKGLYDRYNGGAATLDGLRGVFGAAHADLLKGRANTVEILISGEVLGDFTLMAKAAFKEGAKDVAAVLVAASLEDALKRYAKNQGLDVEGKTMTTVINALKGKGLISGARKSLADTLPEFRDRALHAEWAKISSEEVAAAIGFVEEFLNARFSA